MDADQNIRTTSVQRPRTGTIDQPFRPDSLPPPGTPPAVGDRYQVATMYRSGGLGRVWIARDTALGRDVALKDLRPERGADPRLRARFVEEARITGQLEHPFIVPLYDLIDGPDGPCYTMRFVAGRTLAEAAREYLDRRTAGRATRLDLAELLDAFVAVCRAVAYAHSRGVLHRDLKGQNVVLGQYGEVFVLDWGLAKPTAGGRAGAAGISGSTSAGGPAVVTPSPVGSRDETVAGAILGTPAFLAPEQARGDSASMASDIYGLGAMLYVILTGGPPYDGPTMQDVIEKVAAGAPPRPRMVNPACPAALEAICLKAMARDAEARYSLAEAVAADVRRWLADEPVAAYREAWLARAARWARRHRAAVAGGLAVLLTAVVALAVSTTLIWHEERRTAEQRDRAEQRLSLARGLSDSLLDLSEKHLAPVAAAEDSRRAAVDEALAAARQTLGEQPDDPATQEWAARLFRYSANIHRLINDTAGAAASYAEALRLYDALSARSPNSAAVRNLLAETLRDQAQLASKLGDLAAAATSLRRAIDLANGLRAAAPDNANYRRTLASSLFDLAEVQAERGQSAAAEATATQAADLFRDLLNAPKSQAYRYDRTILAAALSQQAAARRKLGRLDDALAAHIAAFTEFQAIMAPGDQNDRHFYGRALVERARTYALLPNRRDRVERDLGDAIKIWSPLQERSPRTAAYREWLAVAYTTRGEFRTTAARESKSAVDVKSAADDLDKSRKILEALGNENASVASYLAELGRTYAALGRLASIDGNKTAAATWFDRSVTTLRAALDRAPEAAAVRTALDVVEAENAGTGPDG